jgi:anti-sigma factor RsiW
VTVLLHGYLDGELDLVRSLDVERHLESCPACSDALARHRALSQAIGAGNLYFRSGQQLRQRVRAALRQGQPVSIAWPGPARRRRYFGRALVMAAALVFVAILTWGILNLRFHPAENALAREVVSDHVRSLMAEHLYDVESTDAHTVKPWFHGRVDFAPPVRDLAEQGFPLKGARLDYLDNRKVAALVYMRRKHIINVFTWPTDAATEPVAEMQRDGFNILHWSRGGFAYWIISDLNLQDMRTFAELLQK